MTGFIAWLLGSRIGRYTAIFLLGLSTIGAVILVATRRGAEGEKARQTAVALANAMQRIKTNDQIEKMSRSDRRDHLRKWMRNE